MIKAWHFLPKNRRLRFGRSPIQVAGSVEVVTGKPVLCEYGLHGSVDLIDALRYAPGPILCRVEIGGDVIEGNDKIVGTTRRVLWLIDAERALWRYVCDESRRSLGIHGLSPGPNPGVYQAIELRERWLGGESVTPDQWDAARAAARAAAWDATWASAKDAAWVSARAAAKAAARAAARASSRAAWDAEAAAGISAQNRLENALVGEALRLGWMP